RAGALHGGADESGGEAVAGRDGGVGGGVEACVVEEDGVCGGEGAGGCGAAMEELTASEVFGHWCSPEFCESKKNRLIALGLIGCRGEAQQCCLPTMMLCSPVCLVAYSWRV